MQSIVYIHGAGRNGSCFDVLRERLPEHNAINFDYDCFGGEISDIVARLAEHIPDEPVDLIGHSLGGAVGLLLAHRAPSVRRIFTMATPFGGCEAATFMQFMTYGRGSFYRDVATTSPYVWRMLTTPLTVPVMAVVATGGGSFLLPQPNDGVVSVASQMALMGANYRMVHLAHSEVLLSQEVANHAEEFLFAA